MTQWDYKILTLRIVRSTGKMSGFFNRQELARVIDSESEDAMKELGAQGWELVNVTMMDFGTYGGTGPTYAAAFFKRPRAADTPAG